MLEKGNTEKLTDLIERQKSNDKVCIRYGNQTINYKELYLMSTKLLDQFSDEQLGNHVGIFLPNSIDYAVAYFSILFRKKTVIPIPYYSKSDEIISSINYCELNLIITDQEGYKKLKAAIHEDFKSKLLNINTGLSESSFLK